MVPNFYAEKKMNEYGPHRKIPAGHLANFAARLSSNFGPELVSLVQRVSQDREATELLYHLRVELGIYSGQMAFDRPINMPVEMLSAIEGDKELKTLWVRPEDEITVYSEVDVIFTIERFALWVAIALQYLNLRYSVKKKTASGREYEYGIGTSGLYISIKDQFEAITKKINERLGGAEVSEAIDVIDESPKEIVEINEPLVLALNDHLSDPPAVPTHNLLSGPTQTIGGLFEVEVASDVRRQEMLRRLAALYWDVNSPPKISDGIPGIADVFSKKDWSSVKALVTDEMPRGYTVDIGESRDGTNDPQPFVCITSVMRIPGSASRKRHRFVHTPAGRLVSFVRDYVGSDNLAVYFVEHNNVLHQLTGSKIALDSRNATVRALVVGGKDDENWALFPGHVVLTPETRGLPLEQVCKDAEGSQTYTETTTSSTGSLVETGSVVRILLTASLLQKGLVTDAVDLGVAKLDKTKSTRGIGQYLGIAPTYLAGDLGDASMATGRVVVTKALDGTLRWGRIKGFNKTLTLNSRASGHSIRLSKAVGVVSAGDTPFAVPGMSGSLVFLLPESAEPFDQIVGEVICIGTIVGSLKYSLLTNDDMSLTPKSKDSKFKEEFYVQPLGAVLRQFNYLQRDFEQGLLGG